MTTEECYGLTAHPTRDSTPSDSLELDTIAASWARLGVLFGVEPSREQVDVELLICLTARVAPEDERLFVCAASWIAEHHALVNGARLSALAAQLDPAASAVLGALLSLAGDAAGGAHELEAARVRCHPLATPEPLFVVMRSMHVLTHRAAAMPCRLLPRGASGMITRHSSRLPFDRWHGSSRTCRSCAILRPPRVAHSSSGEKTTPGTIGRQALLTN